MKRIILLLLASLLMIMSTPAEARRHYRHHHAYSYHHAHRHVVPRAVQTNWRQQGPTFGIFFQRPRQPTTAHRSYRAFRVFRAERHTRVAHLAPHLRQLSRAYGNTVMLAHPAGCPRTLFCGCGAAVDVFGKPVRDLWLAANWLRFPSAAPAPGMVAARSGHVFVLKAQNSDGSWQVADYNSGGHMSRLHTRSLSGYRIVNPHG